MEEVGEGKEVAGLVLAYGLGLAPLILALLLFESGYDPRYKTIALAAAIPGFYVFWKWMPLVYFFWRAHMKAFVPSMLLLVGVLGVLGWAVSLWMRLRRVDETASAGGKEEEVSSEPAQSDN